MFLLLDCYFTPAVFTSDLVSMASRKRCREADMLIKVAVGDSIPASSLLLRTFSTCAEQLPADADAWDVSGLLLNSQPFSRAAVQCWLHCAHSHLHGPTELNAEDLEQLSTATTLYEVLAFAHAVGSCEGMLHAACHQLDALKFVVQLPEQTLELFAAASAGLHYKLDRSKLQLSSFSLGQTTKYVGTRLTSTEQRVEVKHQVAAQIEALLRMAHLFRLQPLLSALHDFICRNGMHSRLLHSVLGQIFTQAVLDAAVGTGSLTKETYVSSVLLQPHALLPSKLGASAVLMPLGSVKSAGKDGRQAFTAQLLQDFAGCKAGSKVTATLELFNGSSGASRILLASSTNFIYFPVQLLLGQTVASAAELDVLLNKP